MHLAIWIVTAFVFGLWSLLAYGMAGLLGLGAGLAGLPAEVYAWLGQLPGAPWLDDYLPGWRETIVAVAQGVGAVLGWLGSVAPVLVWIVWGLGSTVLVLCAALMSGLVALARKAAPPPSATLA